MEELAVQLIGSAVVAVIAALVTVQLSLKQFSAQKIWERKLDAYTAILDSLHNMKRDLEVSYNAELERREVPSETADKLRNAYQAGRTELLRQADTGDLIIAESAMISLRKLVHRLSTAGNAPTYFEHLDGNLAAVACCLKEMRSSARKDLKISNSFWRIK